MSRPTLVVVWGNCQAAPLGDLLRTPLASAGLEIVDVPPVYLATEEEIAAAHRLVGQAALFISQPIREEYRFPGSGTAALAARLPRSGRLIAFPTSVHIGPFPFLVHGHDSVGTRVEAPLTDYHDLRTLVAASRGMDLDATLSWWPQPTAQGVLEVSADSVSRLQQREAALDLRVSDLVTAPGALWSINHPSNAMLAEVARRVLEAAGIDAPVQRPAREYLAERRAPVEATVAAALDWPSTSVRQDWVVRGRRLPLADVVRAHLAFYADRLDVVADAVARHSERIGLLLHGDGGASAPRTEPRPVSAS